MSFTFELESQGQILFRMVVYVDYLSQSSSCDQYFASYADGQGHILFSIVAYVAGDVKITS